MKRFLFISIIIIFLFPSCEIWNPEEELPSYVHVEPFTLEVDSGQGSNSHKITDGWVYINDDFQGVFELPATFPILFEGNIDIQIRPGIKNNGTSTNKVEYAMYAPYDNDTSFVATKMDTTTIYPTTRYYETVNFIFTHDFEEDTSELKIGDNYLINSSENFFEGAKSCKFTNQDSRVDVYTPFYYLNKGKTIYLELDYFFESNISIGLQATNGVNSSKFYYYTIPPKKDNNGNIIWNKIYIDLSTTVNQAEFNNMNNFRILFQTIDYNTTNYIDNLKLLYK